MKILQLGSYGQNIGDELALQTIRNHLPSHWKWINWSFRDILSANQINKYNMLIIGGGGLIEGDTWGVEKGGNGW